MTAVGSEHQQSRRCQYLTSVVAAWEARVEASGLGLFGARVQGLARLRKPTFCRLGSLVRCESIAPRMDLLCKQLRTAQGCIVQLKSMAAKHSGDS